MGRRTVDMEGVTTVIVVLNSKRGAQYHSTIQNNTGQTITGTVSNDEVNFTNPATGVLTIADTLVGEITEPYVQLALSIPMVGAAGAEALIMESG